MQTLRVAYKFVGSYAYVDFHHRALACPSYNRSKKCLHFLLCRNEWDIRIKLAGRKLIRIPRLVEDIQGKETEL